MVNLGANLGHLGFAAFLRRTAAPWPAVTALESRESVSSAADRRNFRWSPGETSLPSIYFGGGTLH